MCLECCSSRRPVCNRWTILPASPRRVSSGSYVRSDIPIQTSSNIPKRGLCGVSSYQKRTKSHENRHYFVRNMAEEGGTGAKPARGTRGQRVVPAARPESAPYRRLDVGSDTPLAALLTLPRQWTYPPRPAGSTRSAVERRPYRKNKKQLEPKF